MPIYKYRGEFDFQKFLEFYRELVEVHKLGEVVFAPKQGKDLFTEIQLVHTAPGWGLEDSNGFLHVWRKNTKIVRRVSFKQFKKDGSRHIKMTVDLDKKTISLDEVEGITAQEIEDSLKKFIPVRKILLSDEKVNKWWKYTHPIWWIRFLTLLIFRDGIGSLIKLAWKHKVISAIAILLLIPLIVQLLANYLTYKFGWYK